MKDIVLTFDDGPDSRYTPVLLDLLRYENIPAAFFVVGNHAKAHPDLIRRMIDEGHTIGGHTMTHKNLLLSSPSYIHDDFAACAALHKNLTGEPLHYFRPPWGINTPLTGKYVRKYGLTQVLWDVMAQDWEAQASATSIVEKIKTRVFDGAVLCLHDAGEDTGGAKGAPMKMIESLIYIIPWLKSQGYHFITLDQYIEGVNAHDIPQRKKNLLWA